MNVARQVSSARQRISATSWAFTDTPAAAATFLLRLTCARSAAYDTLQNFSPLPKGGGAAWIAGKSLSSDRPSYADTRPVPRRISCTTLRSRSGCLIFVNPSWDGAPVLDAKRAVIK